MNSRFFSTKTYLTILVGFLSISLFAQEPRIKNVILLIGDGMGLTQVHSAMVVSRYPMNMQRARFIGLSNTSSAGHLITDSGAGGTALSTGKKTKNYAIGVDTNGKPLKTIVEYAEENNKSTGLVTTCNLTHATPASFVAHQPDRYMEAEIARDYTNAGVDVLIGGGAYIFDSLGITAAFKEKGYDVSYQLDKIGSIMPVACFVAEDHPKSVADGRGNYLEESVGKALSLLSKDEDGFFLMVEGSQIDWMGHANDFQGTLLEVLDFDKAVGKAFDYADKNPGTLVIVTADHETGGLSMVGGDLKTRTVTGAFGSTNHTAVLVPIYAYGTGSSAFSTFMDNTDIFHKIMSAYGFTY